MLFRKAIILLVLFSNSATLFSQSDSIVIDKKKKDRYGIWLIPSAATNIYGIAIGPVGSEAICKRPYTKYSHGLNLQIPGQGFIQCWYLNKGFSKSIFDTLANVSDRSSIDSIPKRVVHNGILLSPFGSFSDQVNGVSFSLWMSLGEKINGFSFNLLWNLYEEINGVSIGFVNHTGVTNGIQIGVVNKTVKLKGFQLGLWNKNEKRSLPIINWNFKDKKRANKRKKVYKT